MTAQEFGRWAAFFALENQRDGAVTDINDLTRMLAG